MLTTTTILLLILISNATVSLAILATNPRRPQNRFFTLFSSTMSIWVLFVLSVINAKTQISAMIYIRGASIAGALVPPSFFLLCQAISKPEDTLLLHLRNASAILLLGAAISIMCCTGFFLENVVMPENSLSGITVPEAIYGPGFTLFTLYFPIVFALTIYNFIKIIRASTGIERVELQFVLTSIAMAIPISLLIHISAVLLNSSQPQQYGPISIIPINFVIAYGIATRRILGIATVLRQLAAISFLICYIVFSYLLLWVAIRYGVGVGALENSVFLQLIATLIIVLTASPIHRRLHQAAEKIISSNSVDIQTIMKEAGDVFRTITTIDALQNHFLKLLTNTLRTKHITIAVNENGCIASTVTSGIEVPEVQLDASSELVELITKTQAPVCLDSLQRVRETKLIKNTKSILQNLEASLAVGFFSSAGLGGIVLLGARKSGRIYDRNEQDALQLLCNQFAVELENAHLYTKMQNSKIQNEIMLDQLISGVIVANPEQNITLFNHEAQRITGINDKAAIGQNIAILPREIYLALEVTLENKNGVRNIDASLFPREDDEESSKNIRMGSAFLFGHDGKPMGALLVFTDITELKGLEEQVRRTDQLSSVGTLAAGMAHEIKNPLVTIKTFTQLLPQRYADDEFRNDFSTLVAHEVARIDGIVNELLSFSKPAKPHLIPMNIQDTIDQTLKLIHEQLSQKNITLKNNCRAQKTEIFGDARLLSQALINLTLNATEAIGQDGTITVGTMNCSHRFASSPDKATSRKCIRLQISDTGKGIERDDLLKIFDPFFTSKSEGTGMGLSVAHGIINEHHGIIEVESEPNRGSTFYIYIPILEEETAT